MSDEEQHHALDRPPTQRKYRRVGEEEQDGKSSNVTTTKIIAAPVSLGVDLTKDIIHKASNTLTKAGKAAASSVEKIRRASNDAIQTDGSSHADDTTTMPAVSHVLPHELTDNADETPTLGTALQRPQRRKYRPVDGLLDKDDDSASFHKVASEAAAILATPVVLTKTVMTKTSDIAKATVEGVQKGVQKQLSSSRHSERNSPVDEACSSVTMTDNNNEGSSTTTNTTAAASSTTPLSPEFAKQPPLSSSSRQDSKHMLPSSPPPTLRPKETTTKATATATTMASMDGVKKAMEGTARNITKNIEKAKNLVKEKPKQLQEEDATTTKVGVASNQARRSDKKVSSSQSSGGGGNNDDGKDDNASTKTVGGGGMNFFRTSVQKTRGRLQRMFLRRNNKRKTNVKSEASSITSDITMDHFHSSLTEVKQGIKIVVTPFIGILLHDVTIAVLILSLLAAIPTAYNWTSIMKHQLPISLIVLWLIVAFLVGMEIGRVKGMRTVLNKDKTRASSLKGPHTMDKAVVTDTTMVSGHVEPPDLRHSLPSEILVAQVCEDENEPVKEGYALFYTLVSPFSNVWLLFPEDAVALVTEPVEAAKHVTDKCWSTLTHEIRETWEMTGFIMVADPLMQRLLKNPDYARKPLKEVILEEQKEYERSGDINSRIGAFDISKCDAFTLESVVIDPCMTLRGMDIFLTDDPEDDLSSHPFLFEQGLRKTPSMLVNIMVQWANIVVYFQLPEWFTDFDSIVENDDDPPDVIACKRFVNNDDAYRNKRFKILPCLVDGPLPIRIIAPPKKEITVQGSILPTKWIKHAAKTSPDGSTLHPCLELEVDMVSNSTLRSVSGMLRKYIKAISLDLAVIIAKPTPNDPDEPSACVGLWRFDHINIDRCPPLPSRTSNSLAADVFRASSLSNLSPQELVTITEEAGDD